ncbi:MAG: flavodoxin domain-containing protein [Methanomicrobiaceae archaeon]|nr:flavodoxin domain-containing protein [Methanomicrobiaceae archaeon]MDD5418793.1 hypothetical protein [Methanomicrobiaceae archaeon]
MKVGIVIHSRTGNTHSVGGKLMEALIEAGHEAEIERVLPAGGEGGREREIVIENPPDVGAYDAVVFGAPVHGFSVSKEMETYLVQVPSLRGKKIACFVTKGLPFYRTGGTQAISRMKDLCEAKGGTVCKTGIVIWNKQREEQIAGLAEELAGCFAAIPA